MSFSLFALSRSELATLADSGTPANLIERAEPGSMPPAFVAARSLAFAQAGHPPPWSTSFLVVDNATGRFVGACGFKTIPLDGRVEVGYGVAPSARGRGAATGALEILLARAFATGVVEVLAEIERSNTASTRVVQKLGFQVVGERVDRDDEHLVQWLKRDDGLTWDGEVPFMR